MATIAEVLHYAADNFLANSGIPSRGTHYYSCLAVKKSARILRVPSYQIMIGLRNMGVDPASIVEFSDVRDTQGARYLWLKFAALIAEEQGV
jgi:hypothetical protein